jgi:hypothetical protein
LRFGVSTFLRLAAGKAVPGVRFGVSMKRRLFDCRGFFSILGAIPPVSRMSAYDVTGKTE